MRRGVLASALGLKDIFRQRPELAVFAVGAALFAGGLASVLSGQLSVDADSTELRERRPPATIPTSKPGRIGPAVDEPVAPYIARKKALLSAKVSQEPASPTLGMMVFGSYRKVSQVEALVKARGLRPVAVQMRVPLDTFRPVQVAVEGNLGSALSDHKASIQDELEVLDRVVSDVSDPGFKAAYGKDADRKREAIRLLENDPATIFAVIVSSTYANLAKLADPAQVRYIDVPDEPVASLSDVTFAALVPEDTDRAGFALK